ncbi:hypothetical protein [Ammoniphilus sp. 3BR4]|uniref:hypothetical protein n=1 Tax=Ammoniphilus sp. 3BR4 TaxID=3158265 RepID=UPI00346585D4
MRLTGEIFRKRHYFDHDDKRNNCITFILCEKGILFKGDIIKIIPILSNELEITKGVGEKIEVEGKIEFRCITTPNGERSRLPIPVIRLCG